jgi:hypothetical protein
MVESEHINCMHVQMTFLIACHLSSVANLGQGHLNYNGTSFCTKRTVTVAWRIGEGVRARRAKQAVLACSVDSSNEETGNTERLTNATCAMQHICILSTDRWMEAE